MPQKGPSQGRSPIRPVPMPQGRRTAYRPLVAVPPASTLTGVILSPAYEGFSVHFHSEKKRCVPCVLPAPCYCDGAKIPSKWVGYVELAVFPSLKRVILILPLGAVKHCQELQEQNGRLRGKQLWAWRLKPNKNGPVKLRIGDLEKQLPPLPEPTILMVALMDAWYEDMPGDGIDLSGSASGL